jgi:hypothetical protein
MGTSLGLTLLPLFPASDPLWLHVLPGASILVASFVAAFASVLGIHQLFRRSGRWWGLLGFLLALGTNALSLTTLQAILLLR